MWHVDMLYNPEDKGFMFYINDIHNYDIETIKFFLSDKEIRNRNLDICSIRDLMINWCNAYGREEGLQRIRNYFNEE